MRRALIPSANILLPTGPVSRFSHPDIPSSVPTGFGAVPPYPPEGPRAFFIRYGLAFLRIIHFHLREQVVCPLPERRRLLREKQHLIDVAHPLREFFQPVARFRLRMIGVRLIRIDEETIPGFKADVRCVAQRVFHPRVIRPAKKTVCPLRSGEKHAPVALPRHTVGKAVREMADAGINRGLQPALVPAALCKRVVIRECLFRGSEPTLTLAMRSISGKYFALK